MADNMSSEINERLLEEKLIELEKAKSWHPRVISKLEALIHSPDDSDLFRINPIQFAQEKSILEQEAVDLFLYGTKAKIFKMNWELFCPTCGEVVESFKSLRFLNAQYHCFICMANNNATLDDYISISFTILPEIREIVFHDPDSLSIEDFAFKYVFGKEALAPGGTLFKDAIAQMTKIISYIEPNEKKEFEIEVEPGVLGGVDLLNKLNFSYQIADKQDLNQSLSIKLDKDKVECKDCELSSGKVKLVFENTTDHKGAILVWWEPPGMPHDPLDFVPFLSGKKLLSTQSFRKLFRFETIKGNEGIGVKDITILFTDLKGSTALYERIGDLKAFSLVYQHFDSLEKVINKNNGAVVKTIGDAVMATFLNPLDGMNGALEILKEIENFNKEHSSKDFILKIGLHARGSIAVTLNDRMDYFGQTVNIAARVQGLASEEEIFITNDIYNYPNVKEILKGYEVSQIETKLKGIQKEMTVYKIS